MKVHLMKPILLFLLFCFTAFCFAQQKKISEEALEKIRKDIWIPFMEAYTELDSEKLKSLHTDDIFRVTIDQNEVRTGQSYLEDFGGFLDQVQKDGGGLGIAFALESTAMDGSGDLAYQTGYYEFSSKGKDDPNLMVRGYGHFNVGLRKVNGVWKLFLDSDKRVDIDLEEFEKQEMVYRLGN